MPTERVPIVNQPKTHRKMPSLYLKHTYTTTPGGLQLSRNPSVERGVVNISKESMQSKANQPKRNNFIDSFHRTIGVTDRAPGSSSNPPKHLVSQNSEKKARETKVETPNAALTMSSNERVKSIGLFQKISADINNKEDKDSKGKGSSTRYTQDPNTLISWRDDVVLDIEKELAFTHCLGQGSFAKVYEGVDRNSKQQVAIKVIDKRKIVDPKRRHLIQTEVNLLARMKHRHISEFYRIVEDHKRIFIVMQLCGSQTLNVFCRKFPDKRLNDEQAHAIFIQIAKGVKYMHDHNIAHRDLKLTNMLIDADYIVKIIDFGFACEAEEMHKMYCGTPSYMAPEIVERKLYAPKPTDIWSIGAILFKLLSGEYAFGGKPDLRQPRTTPISKRIS